MKKTWLPPAQVFYKAKTEDQVMISHKTISTNFYRVRIGSASFYFSYETLIAVDDRNGLKIAVNEWSKTTGKHLNQINDNKKIRISHNDLLSYVYSNYPILDQIR